MALITNEGSRAWYQYTSDTDEIWVAMLDAEIAAAGSFTAITESNRLARMVSQNSKRLRMRYIYCGNPGTPRYKFPIATIAAFKAAIIGGALTVGGVQYLITSAHGEKRYMPQVVDLTPQPPSGGG